MCTCNTSSSYTALTIIIDHFGLKLCTVYWNPSNLNHDIGVNNFTRRAPTLWLRQLLSTNDTHSEDLLWHPRNYIIKLVVKHRKICSHEDQGGGEGGVGGGEGGGGGGGEGGGGRGRRR